MSDEYMVTGKMATQRQQNVFLSNQNESMLGRLVYTDFQRRLGSDLNERQKQRLVKTVRHYMNEVSQAMPAAPVQEKNSQVLAAVVPDFLSYINRSASAPPVEEQDVSRMDVASRFNQLQNERNGSKNTPPPPPSFRISLQDDGPSAMSQFEIARKQREEELARGEQLLSDTMRADADFSSASRKASQQEQLILADRERGRLMAQREAASEMATRLVTPDPRRMFMRDVLEGNPTGQGTPLDTILNNTANTLNSTTPFGGPPDGNMTLALPTQIRAKPPQQLDTLIRQEDILAYKENEYNLHIYSADRDWVTNKSQNRYNFTVNFDPANNGPGFTYAPSATVKFKNITRIELVKTILPIEGVDIIQTAAAGPTYSTALNINVLSFPYLNVFIPELDTNNFGTDNYLNQAFASLQYDANWVTDNNTASKGGFLAMIPKFLKCQKVYTPTPLSTLRKLSISIQRPDGCLVSDTLDTLDVGSIVSSYWLTTATGGVKTITNTTYALSSGLYIWINTSTWFSRFTVNQGDRVQFKNLSFPASYTGNAGARDDLLTFLQRPEGHLVVQIAYESPSLTFQDGANSVGYANYIIIRSKMVDPTTGSTSVSTFGNLSAAANNTFLDTLSTTDGAAGRLINLSHQTTLVFRVITRDLDSTARLRPDNVGFGSTS